MALGGLLLAFGVGFVFFRFFYLRVAGLYQFETLVIVTHAVEFVMRRFEVFIRNQDDVGLRAVFQQVDFRTFFVQQESRHVNRYLDVDRGGVVFHRFFLHNAQHVQGGGFDVANHAGAVTARAGDVRAFGQRWTQALTRQFHQAEARNFAHLHARTIVAQRFFQAGFDFFLIFG